MVAISKLILAVFFYLNFGMGHFNFMRAQLFLELLIEKAKLDQTHFEKGF